jgi:hypothetical protein
VSTTVIVCTQLVELPHSSTAVQVRVTTPVSPQSSTKVLTELMLTLLQLSLPVAVPRAPWSVASPHSTVASAGQSIEGAVVSTTAITWSQLVLLPHSSVDVHLRVINSVLAQPLTVLSTEPMLTLLQLSLPVAVPLAATLVSAGQSSTASAGQLIEGAVVSTTVITWRHLVLLPHSSVDVHVRSIVSVLPQPAVDTSL